MIDHAGQVVDRTVLRGRNATLIINTLASSAKTVAHVTDNNNFYRVLTSHIMISSVDTNLTGHMRTQAHAPIDFRTLAARWMISPEQAQQTIAWTTKRGVRTCLNPTIARKYPTNDQMLQYKRLPHPMFSGTMFAGTTSVGKNKCGQVYATSFGWCRDHPMKQKGEAHKTLSLLFHRDGVLQAMIVDGSKEQVMGKFR